MKIDKIPSELKFKALWCCWKLEEVDGKNTKVPYNPRTGYKAKSNDKNTFASFKVTLNNLHKYLIIDENNRFRGGLGLGIFDGFSAVDIDHCIENGVISDMAKDIINHFKSYTEISPSGTGVRIIFKNEIDVDFKKYYIHNKKNQLEIYISESTNKYLTITGNSMNISETIQTVNVTEIMEKYMLRPNQPKKNKKEIINNNNTEIDVFLKKDSKLNELWSMSASGFGGNENETDVALISKLMFYFRNDIGKVTDLFEQSPYFNSKDEAHLKKWQREDYKQGIFNLTHKDEVYNPAKLINNKFELTDTGNAHRFKSQFGENLRYNYDNKNWMVWNGLYWQTDYTNQIKNFVEVLVEQIRCDALETFDKDKISHAKKSANRSGKENMLKECEHLLPITNSILDNYKDHININNGVLNLRTLELNPHKRDFYMSKKSNVNYIQNSNPVKFIKFLNEIFENNQEKINFVRKVFAYGFTGEIDDQAFIIFYGEGSNGKSVLIELMSFILGDYSSVANKDLLLDKKFQNDSQSAVARLMGKRTIFVSETENGDKLKEAFVKDITGGNEITARFLYANEFTFKPEFTPILVTNHLPIIDVTDYAILRRLCPVNFSRIFEPHEQNINLLNELKEEKDEIFSWIVDSNWYESRLERPQFLLNNLNSYKKEMDYVQKWIDDWCLIKEECEELSSTLFTSFNDYCIMNNFRKMTATMFGRVIGKKFKKSRSSKGNVYLGIITRKNFEV